jgi:hypothetical protein
MRYTGAGRGGETLIYTGLLEELISDRSTA